MIDIKSALANIQIIMINTTLPANIGSAARAMYTMGLSDLTVVDPKHPIDDSSYAHAAGATHILDNINIVKSLDLAINDSQLIFAASSRSRTMPRPVVTPEQAANITSTFINNQLNNTQTNDSQTSNDDTNKSSKPQPKISILFGREDRGLTNEELAVADYHIQIDANPDYPVLNVASAVQVISSFFYSHFIQIRAEENISVNNDNRVLHQIRQDWDSPAISHSKSDELNKKIIALMQNLTLADEDNLGLLPQRLARLTSRVQLDQKEYQLLSAVVNKLSKLTN